MIKCFQYFVLFKILHLLRNFDDSDIFETLIWSNHKIFKIVEQHFDFKIKVDVETTLIAFWQNLQNSFNTTKVNDVNVSDEQNDRFDNNVLRRNFSKWNDWCFRIFIRHCVNRKFRVRCFQSFVNKQWL